MQSLIKILLPITLIIVAAVLAFFVFPKFKASPEKHVVEKKAVLVEAQAVERRSRRFIIQSQGVVRPRTETVLAAEVSGKITKVSEKFIAGGFLNKGEVLLEIDPSDYRVGVKLAEATLASRQAQFSSEKARSEQALKDWQRLHGNSNKPNDLVLRLPQLAEAKANVSAAEADLERAQRNLERTRIRMPYAGLVREKRVDIGQFVVPGAALGRVFAVDLVEIRLPVTTQELAYINLPELNSSPAEHASLVSLHSNTKGDEATIWQSSLVRSEGVVDEKSRQTYLVAQVIDPYGLLGQSKQPPLAVGAFLSAKIEGKSIDNVAVIPRHSLTDDGQVMVASVDNKLEFRQVEIIRTTAEEVFVGTGLEAGDRVITTAINAPVEGMLVRVRGAATDAEELNLENALNEFLPQPESDEDSYELFDSEVQEEPDETRQSTAENGAG